MNQTPKVSVIVPVYNVEKLITRCVDSILGQKYQNLEIILVDDGSTDSCAQICKEYARRSPKVIFLSKKNGGQASARNLGLKHATGDLIGFVDSDDFIDENFYSSLVRVQMETNADIVTCGYALIKENDLKIQRSDCPECGKIVMLRETEIPLEIAKDKILKTYVWDKLYKRELFENILFPEGHIFEDVQTISNVLCRAKLVVVMDEILYGYTVREGSTMTIKNAQRFLDEIDAYKYQLEILKKRNIECCKYIEYKLPDLIRRYIEKAPNIDENSALIQQMRDLYKKHLRYFLIGENHSIKSKISIVVCMICPSLYCVISRRVRAMGQYVINKINIAKGENI